FQQLDPGAGVVLVGLPEGGHAVLLHGFADEDLVLLSCKLRVQTRRFDLEVVVGVGAVVHVCPSVVGGWAPPRPAGVFRPGGGSHAAGSGWVSSSGPMRPGSVTARRSPASAAAHRERTSMPCGSVAWSSRALVSRTIGGTVTRVALASAAICGPNRSRIRRTSWCSASRSSVSSSTAA